IFWKRGYQSASSPLSKPSHFHSFLLQPFVLFRPESHSVSALSTAAAICCELRGLLVAICCQEYHRDVHDVSEQGSRFDTTALACLERVFGGRHGYTWLDGKMPSTRRLFRAAGLISWSASALSRARAARRERCMSRYEPGMNSESW